MATNTNYPEQDGVGDGDVWIDDYPFQMYKVNGKKKASYRPVKLFLIKKYGICFHCGKPVEDIVMENRKLPPHAATIDHLMPRQFRKRHARTQKVLSCWECNDTRNKETQANHPNLTAYQKAHLTDYHNNLIKKGKL